MFFLSLIGFLALFVLGCLFIVPGLFMFWWTFKKRHMDWFWALPCAIGAFCFYLAFVCAPFTLVLKLPA